MDDVLNRGTLSGVFTVSAAFLVTGACLAYVYLNQAFDLGTLVIGVIIPSVFGSILLVSTRHRVLFFVFLAYFLTLVDDAPVHFDSVLTWPEVTRYQPVIPYLVDFILLGSVFLLLILALRETAKGGSMTPWRKVADMLLVVLAFGLSYLQDFESEPIHGIVVNHWYELDLVEHIASGAVLYLALRMAVRWGGAGAMRPAPSDRSGQDRVSPSPSDS